MVDEQVLLLPDQVFSVEVIDTLRPAIEAAYGDGGLDAWNSGLTSTNYSHPVQHAAVLLYGLAANEAWRRKRPEPAAVIGHSLGIYAAAVGAGAISPVDAVRLVLAAGAGIERAQRATGLVLLAVTGLTAPRLKEILAPDGGAGEVRITHYNSTIQHIVSGHEETLTEIARKAERDGALGTTILPFPGVVHRPDLAPFADDFYAIIDEVEVRPPRTRFYSPVCGGLVETATGLRAAIRDQLTAPVRFLHAVHGMAPDGIDEFAVLGPCAQLVVIIRWLCPEARASLFPSAVEEVHR